MNRQLAEAVVATFREHRSADLHSQLTQFDEREWARSLKWLHTSGLALYFLARVKQLGMEDAVPLSVLRGLEINLAQNRVRNEDLFREFARINMEFQRAKLSYANLKGFTLAPRAFPDPAYRYQHDLDFLVSRRDAERCRQAAERQGYRLNAVFGDTWEFRAGKPESSSMRDLYKVRAQRSLEVHLVSDLEPVESHQDPGRLARLQLQMWNGFEFPSLSDSDRLLGQALHLFKHFQTEWTRLAWILEYSAAIHSHRADESVWEDAGAAIAAAPENALGIGMATLFAMRTFGVVPPASFLACTVETLPQQVRLWADRYEADLVFLEHPGSKLYLLLNDVLLRDRPDWHDSEAQEAFSLHGCRPRDTIVLDSIGLRVRTGAACARLRFLWARLRFHVTAGVRYKIEAARWKKVVTDSHV